MEHLNINISNVNAVNKLSENLSTLITQQPIILCIGSDKFISDSLGPLTGYKLSKYFKNNLYGTLENPVNALNINYTINEIKKNHPNIPILAIDAAITEDSLSLHNIRLKSDPIQPGKALNRNLQSIGDFSITGITDIKSNSLFGSNVRLHHINIMADIISLAIIKSFN